MPSQHQPDRESLFAAASFVCDHLAPVRLTGQWMPLPHASMTDKIYAVTGGRGRLWLQGDRYDLHAGQALFIPAGTWQCGVSDADAPLTKTYMHFTSLTGGTLHLLRFYPPPIRLTGKPAAWIIQTMLQAQAEWDAARPGRQLALKAMLLDMLLQAYRAPADTHQPADVPRDQPAGPLKVADRQYDAIRQSITRITASLDQPLTLRSLAEEAGLSPSYFNRLFARLVGMPPMRFLEDERLRRAQAMLTTHDLPIARIAAQCGYADSNYFSRVFQRRLGCSPSAYRQNLPTPPRA